MTKASSIQSYQKADLIGVFASSSCLVHCLATPLLFVAQSCSISCCETGTTWWQYLDYIFLVISFFAVYRSNQTTTNSFLGAALWVSWTALLLTIINEKLHLLPLSEIAIYLPALALIILHLINRKYCQCKDESCLRKNIETN